MSRFRPTLTVVVLAVSVCVNILLAWRVRSLSGKSVVVDYSRSAKPTVLYIFTPTCVWCRRNLRNLRELAKGISRQYTVVGVSLTREGLGDYVASSGFPAEIVADIPPSVVMDYRLGGTPQTIVVSGAGRVLKNWRGAYGGRVKAEVEGFFGVRLPDDVGGKR